MHFARSVFKNNLAPTSFVKQQSNAAGGGDLVK